MSISNLGAALIRRLPVESAHRATLRLVRLSDPFRPMPAPDDPRLKVSAFGLDFPNPVGLAAGFDKNAEAPGAMAKFGFGLSNAAPSRPGRKPGIRARACSG